MGIEYAVLRPAPGGMRLDLLASKDEFFEASEKHTPEISVPRRQRAPVREPLHTSPRKRKLDRPALIHRRAVVQLPVYADRRLHTRKIPVEERPADATWMRATPEGLVLTVVISAERKRASGLEVEFRNIELGARLQRILPDEE